MLSKIGENFPDLEKVVLSMKVGKINKRKKEQTRVLLLTDKAMFVGIFGLSDLFFHYFLHAFTVFFFSLMIACFCHYTSQPMPPNTTYHE